MRTEAMRHKSAPEQLNDKELYLELQDTRRAMAMALEHEPMGFEAAEGQALWIDEIKARQEAVEAEIERRRLSRIGTIVAWGRPEGIELVECSPHPFFDHKAPQQMSPQALLDRGRAIRAANPQIKVWQSYIVC